MSRAIVAGVLGYAALLAGCGSSGTGAGEAAPEQDITAGTSLTCTPTDTDEACGDNERHCVDKLVLVKTGANAATLTVTKTEQSTDGMSQPPTDTVLTPSVSFHESKGQVSGSWDGGKTTLDLKKDGANFSGSALVDGAIRFTLTCGNAPLVLKTGKAGDACNGKNAAQQIVRCEGTALKCADNAGNEIALLENTLGTCQARSKRLVAVGASLTCTPTDGDEACSGRNEATCVSKLVLQATTATTAKLTVAKTETLTGGAEKALPDVTFAKSASYVDAGGKIAGSWDGGKTTLALTQDGPNFSGTMVTNGLRFLFQCGDLPLVVKTGKIGEACNTKNDKAQTVRCEKGLVCTTSAGQELTLLDKAIGTCVAQRTH